MSTPTVYECEDCDFTGLIDDLAYIDDCQERVTHGELMAAGQCPECGSLVSVADADVPDYTIDAVLDIAKDRGKLPQAPKIRFILHAYTSYPDSNGNREAFAHVRSTVTGKSLSFRTYSASNARALLFKVLGNWEGLDASETDLPIRQWKGAAKGVPYNVELSEILALEQVTP